MPSLNEGEWVRYNYYSEYSDYLQIVKFPGFRTIALYAFISTDTIAVIGASECAVKGDKVRRLNK